MTASPSQVSASAAPGADPPPFRYVSRVFFDELDPMGVLHNSRYSVHVERAVGAFYESQGFRWEASIEDNPDKFHVVRRFEVDLERPYSGTGPLHVDLWLDHFGRTSIRYGFACVADDGQPYASGLRLVVKLDPATFRPVEWTQRWREAHVSALPPART
jgi:acyl-CoA thioester hydrolase